MPSVTVGAADRRDRTLAVLQSAVHSFADGAGWIAGQYHSTDPSAPCGIMRCAVAAVESAGHMDKPAKYWALFALANAVGSPVGDEPDYYDMLEAREVLIQWNDKQTGYAPVGKVFDRVIAEMAG